jgi:hypothetical protein
MNGVFATVSPEPSSLVGIQTEARPSSEHSGFAPLVGDRSGSLSCSQKRRSMASSLIPVCRGSASLTRRSVGLQLSLPGSSCPVDLAAATFVYHL